MKVRVVIPDEYAELLVPPGEDFARSAIEFRTAQAYREGRITIDWVRLILDHLGDWELNTFLTKYGLGEDPVDDSVASGEHAGSISRPAVPSTDQRRSQ